MTMSPLYSCGKPCSRGTHNETVKNSALFSSIISGIMKESRLRISIPWECFLLQTNRKFYHMYTLTIVIHNSSNLIGTGGIAKFGPKYGQVFHYESLLPEAPPSSQRAQCNKRLIDISLMSPRHKKNLYLKAISNQLDPRRNEVLTFSHFLGLKSGNSHD